MNLMAWFYCICSMVARRTRSCRTAGCQAGRPVEVACLGFLGHESFEAAFGDRKHRNTELGATVRNQCDHLGSATAGDRFRRQQGHDLGGLKSRGRFPGDLTGRRNRLARLRFPVEVASWGMEFDRRPKRRPCSGRNAWRPIRCRKSPSACGTHRKAATGYARIDTGEYSLSAPRSCSWQIAPSVPL